MKGYKEIGIRLKNILAIDQNTSGTKVILANKHENIEFGFDSSGDSFMYRLNFIFFQTQTIVRRY